MENYVSTAKLNVSIKLVLACVLWHAIAANGYRLRHASSTIKLPASNFAVDYKRLFSPGMVFGSCEPLALNENETFCLFGIETTSNVGLLEHVQYCNVTHARLDNEEREWPGRLSQIVAIDEDKAVFSFSYSAYSDMSILHFSDCRVIPVDVTGVTYPDPVAPFNGTFGIFAFKDGKTVRTLVDFEGNIIEEQQVSMVPSNHNIKLRSPVKGYLAVLADAYDGQIEVRSYDGQGSVEILKQYTINLPTAYEIPSHKYALSVTHQLLSVCGQRRPNIFCGQFDQNGVLKFEITIPYVEYNYNAYNLQGGGLLFVNFRRSHERFSESYYVTLTTFDGTGRQIGTLQIKEIEKISTDVRKWRFFVNENNEICFSSFGSCHEKSQCVTLDVVCISGDELLPSKLK